MSSVRAEYTPAEVQVIKPATVTVTMSEQAAQELTFLLGNIGGLPHGTARQTMVDPLYEALSDELTRYNAIIKVYDDDGEYTPEYLTVRARYVGLFCDAFTKEDDQ